MHSTACIPVCCIHACLCVCVLLKLIDGADDFLDVQWGANSLVVSSSDLDEEGRESLTKGADVFELPVLRIHWYKIRDAAQ